MHINVDFETRSLAGYGITPDGYKRKDGKNWGVAYSGACGYSNDPSTEVLCMAYSLNGEEPKLWIPGDRVPEEFKIKDIEIRAWNAEFEFWIYKNIMIPCHGFPEIKWQRFVCTMERARAYALPGALKNAARVLHLQNQKLDSSAMDKLAQPKRRTKTNNDLWHSDPELYKTLYEYCKGDVRAEIEAESHLPELTAFDKAFQLLHKKINLRGVQIDTDTVKCLINEFHKCEKYLTEELQQVTEGRVQSANQVKELANFCGLQSVDKKAIAEALASTGSLSHAQCRALEIRQALSNIPVKKLFVMQRSFNRLGRATGQFMFSGAGTGRSASVGIQLQNLPSEPIKGWGYMDALCAITLAKQGKLFDTHKEITLKHISGCLRAMFISKDKHVLRCGDFSAIEAVVLAWLADEQWRLEVFRTHGKIYEMSASEITGIPFEEILEYKKINDVDHPVRKTVGKVAELACLAGDTLVLTDKGYKKIINIKPWDEIYDGCQWVKHKGIINRGHKQVIKIDGVLLTPDHLVFESEYVSKQAKEVNLLDALSFAKDSLPRIPNKNSKDIKIVAGPTNEIQVYDILNAGPLNRFTIKTNSGHMIVHNCGYAGGVGAMINFGADKFMTEEQMQETVDKWRAASPNIVKMWYALERCAVDAVKNPGNSYTTNRCVYYFDKKRNVLSCQLPSGRKIYYHEPRLRPVEIYSKRYNKTFIKQGVVIKHWNSNAMKPPLGWTDKELTGGLLAENVVQAVSNDILRFSMLNVERAGYHIILHVHDEIVSETPEDFGSDEEFHKLMSECPAWAQDCPIRVGEIWSGPRYRK